MDQRHSYLLSELRYAIAEAFGKSEHVTAAIVGLQRAGQAVKIAIDTVLVALPVHAACSHATEAHSSFGGQLILSETDVLFLRDLKISVEIGVNEPQSEPS